MAFLGIIAALVLGVNSGIITGIVPGIHVNLVTVLLLSFSPILLTFTSGLHLAVYIISLAITHTFLDTLPSIYLGAPDESKALSALPGHRLLLKGEAHNAVLYTIIGSFWSLVLGTLLLPLFIIGMATLDPILENIIGYLLIIVMAIMIIREKGKRLKCLIIFLLAGALGMIVFSISDLRQPLFALLSGLFGTSLLIVSLFETSYFPPQDFTKPSVISHKDTAKSVTAATGMGFIAAFLPGFGSSQAAIMATAFTKDMGQEGFLSLVGGINTANMLISIAAAYTIQKARNGAIVGVQELLTQVTFSQMVLFIAVALISGAIGTLLTLRFSRIFSIYIAKVNYSQLIKIIIGFIILLAIIFDGPRGLLILAVATSLGLIANSWGVAKNHLMGCLVVPVILYFTL
ncbi:tripartite tricarboxylate transporter permease [Candidatus Woesearchaeota archaeon]|nr:tripartite tricarboxylate transporter permease [Candidatus Woesearchaeota archaeon]